MNRGTGDRLDHLKSKNATSDVNKVIKSPLDVREYKSLELQNGMKVMLISTLGLAAVKSKGARKNTTCHLKRIFKFNKQFLGLDNDNIKVRCECPTRPPKVVDKTTSTTSDLGSAKSSNGDMEVPLSFSEAIKTIKDLIYGGSSDIPKTESSETPSEEEEEDMSQVASAYVTVGAGYFNDPDDMAGMAHYTEHALFLGSKKYPAPNQLFRLIVPHSGYVNAWTSGPTTVFAVSTSLEIYEVALDMLADAMGFPLLPKDLLSKEIEAVDSEFSLRQVDGPKYLQLLASLGKAGHPLRKMDAGNRETLQVPNFYKKLVQWRSTHYCANYMTLVLEAPLPLGQLEEVAVKYFSDIPSSDMPSPRTRVQWKGVPFDMDRFHRIYHIPSIYHSEFMAIHWTFEPTAWKNLSAKPLDYISTMLRYKGEGGLFHFLNYFGWATNVSGGCWDTDVTMNQFTSVFSITIDLTEEGFYRQDYIMEAVFGYLEMLCRNTPSKSLFRESQRQQADDFHNHAVMPSTSYAESIGRWLHAIKPKLVLIAPQLTSSFDPGLISDYIQQLRMETCNVMIFSKKFNKKEKISGIERFYKTPYASYEFPQGLCEKIERLKGPISQIFNLPKINVFLEEVTCCSNQQNNMVRSGPLMVVKGRVALYYKDGDFRTIGGHLPQAKYVFWFQAPINMDNNKNYSTMDFLVNIFNNMIKSKFVAALSAHHHIQAEFSQGRLELTLIGPSNQLPRITKDLFKMFAILEVLIDKKMFEVGKRQYSENLDDAILDNRWFAWDVMNYLWSNQHYLNSDHKDAIESLDYEDFVQFIKSFKESVYLVGHLYGYLTTEEAFSVVQTVSQFIRHFPHKISPQDIPVHHCPQFPIGESVVRIKSQNARIHTSVVINGYQFGNLSNEEDDIVDFLSKTMSDSAYNALRTTEQLGYIVIVYHEISYTVTTLLIELVTQPKNYTTDYCNVRIDKFIKDFYNDHLSTESKFKEFLLGKPQIAFTLQQLQTLYKKYLIPNTETYRKLSIQVVGSPTDVFAMCEGTSVMRVPDIYLAENNGNEMALDSAKPFKNIKNMKKPSDNKMRNKQSDKGLEYITSSRPDFRTKSEDFKATSKKDRSMTMAACNSKSCKFNPIGTNRGQSSPKARLQVSTQKNSSTPVFQKICNLHDFKKQLKLYPNLDAEKIHRK